MCVCIYLYIRKVVCVGESRSQGEDGEEDDSDVGREGPSDLAR